jgi:uncharacterized phiE125 gp8 family phage protein
MSDQISLAYPGLATPDPYAEPRQGVFVPSILGDLERVTPPSGTVVTLAQVQLQCGREDSDLDALFSDKIDSATELAETLIDGHRQFLTAVYNLPLAGWWCGPQRLPRPPVASVGSVKYYSPDGTLTTLASSNYIVRTPWRQPGSIAWAPNVTPPPLQCGRDMPVVVQFTCGYGAAASVPAAAKQAVLLIVAHAARYRGDDDEKGMTSALEVPPAAVNLLRSLNWGSYS